MHPFIQIMTELLYPRRCPLCDGILGRAEPLLCRDCGRKLRFAKEPRCFRCGRPLEREEQEYCGNCARIRHRFEEGFAPFPYEGVYKESVLRFKYGGRQEYAGFYSAAILRFGAEKIRGWDPQVLVPVPLHRERLLKRGYNQAQVLADSLAEKTGIPAVSGAVIRRKNTAAQKLLGSRERRKNLEQAFAPGKDIRDWKRALIVDDIFTTGSTVDAVEKVLKDWGTERVFFVCVCVTPGGISQLPLHT